MDFKIYIPSFMKKRSFKYGAPFICFVVGGSFGLQEFTQLRYRYSKVTNDVREKILNFGLDMKKPGEVTLESEYEKTQKLNIDNWENKRITRPWDGNDK